MKYIVSFAAYMPENYLNVYIAMKFDALGENDKQEQDLDEKEDDEDDKYNEREISIEVRGSSKRMEEIRQQLQAILK